MTDPFNFKRAEQVAPFADFHGGATVPLLPNEGFGAMDAQLQDVRVKFILSQPPVFHKRSQAHVTKEILASRLSRKKKNKKQNNLLI
ncbi:hypothetical protein KJR58_23595, partial [Escherichia coli]|nr:hypothetical protein [Escherichia coli]